MPRNTKMAKRVKTAEKYSEKSIAEFLVDSSETDRMNIALQMLQVRKGPLCSIRKISIMTGISPPIIRKLNSYYRLAKIKSQKSNSNKSIESVSDIKSELKLEGSVSDVLCLPNDENIDNNKDKKEEVHIVSALIFFLMLGTILTLLYIWLLSPSDKAIQSVILKFSTDNTYHIPKYVAARYLTWYGMRTFFFGLYYFLTLLGIVASLMTVFYASSNTQGGKKNSKIVFLSLLALSFSMANIFINAGSQANMAQHAWRELDICIADTIHKEGLSDEDRDRIIVLKVAEMERYIETFEH